MPVLTLDGTAIAYDDHGRGEPILLLHGFPTTRRLWRGVAPALAEAGFRVVVPDLVGYGSSVCPPTAEPDMASQATWMFALLDALDIRRAAVVAHDIGTAAAQLMLARAPERFRAIVLIDGVFATEWAMDSAAPILSWKEPARLFRVLMRQLRASGGNGKLDEEAVREVLAPYDGEEGGVMLIRAARAMHPKQVEEVLPVLRETRVPALVLWGDRDVYLDAEAVGRPLSELLGAALSVLPGGHFLPLERPDLVASAILAFLGSAR